MSHDENDNGVGRNKDHECGEKTNVRLAALRAAAPLAPVAAVAVTVLVYVAFGEISDKYPDKYNAIAGVVFDGGIIAVCVGMLGAVLVWLLGAFLYSHYTAATTASRRNYILLREKLHILKKRVEHVCPEGTEPQRGCETPFNNTIRHKAYEIALHQCREIEKGLESRGMPWVTGIGYIELWHRVHRAEEALVKLEPTIDALGGAMRDESRLTDSHMRNEDILLDRLRCAVAMLDDTQTTEVLSYLAEPARCTLPPVEKRGTPENQEKALTILSEVRYEINYFRDNVREGLLHARNRLTDTSVALGFAAYALLALAIFLDASYTTICWVMAYFMIGAITGLFARSQAEWNANTAVDDFGLSTARLIHMPWLSGLAAIGGVLILSLVEGQTAANAQGGVALSTIFDGRPILLIVAAVFGIAPDLLIRRLQQQVDKYTSDLESTETSKSTDEDGTSEITEAKHRRRRKQAA